MMSSDLARDNLRVPATQERSGYRSYLSANISDRITEYDRATGSRRETVYGLSDGLAHSPSNEFDASPIPVIPQQNLEPQSDTAALGQSLVLRPGDAWPIDDVLNERSAADPIEPRIKEMRRVRIDDFD